MTKKYQVLWIDDEFQTWGTAFKTIALYNDIVLHGFTSVEEGFNYLRQNLKRFDAILLDVISFENKGQQPGSGHERALDQARDHIMSLKHEKAFPYFVLSGQKSKLDDRSFTHRYEGKLFRKGFPEDTQRLFEAIKEAVDNQEITQLRNDYSTAFTCADSLLGENAGSLLVKVLQGLEKPSTDHDDDSLFNTLRKLVEAFLYAAHHQQLLPDQCLKGSEVNLTAAYYFFASAFSGQPMNPPHGGDSVKLRQTTLPKILTESLRTLIELTSNGSHYQQNALITQGQRQEAKIQLQALRETVRTPYLLAALTYQLLDLLVWLKEIVDKPTLLQAYQNAWDTITTSTNSYTTGTVTGISPNGSGEFTAMPSGEKALIRQSAMQAQPLQVGDEVEVVLKPSDRPGRYQQVVQSLRKTVRPARA